MWEVLLLACHFKGYEGRLFLETVFFFERFEYFEKFFLQAVTKALDDKRLEAPSVRMIYSGKNRTHNQIVFCVLFDIICIF